MLNEGDVLGPVQVRTILFYSTHDALRGTVTKFPELWYSTVIVGHMTMLV